MDRSQDNRSADDASPRQNETDPWGEFLSESSDELLQLQSTHSSGANNGASDGDRHAGIRIVPLLEPSSPSSVADEFLPSETAVPLPEAPPSAAAPAAPRDGAPPFTRRVSYGRTYESPLASGPPPATTQSASADTSGPLLETPAASSLLRPAPAADERAPLIYPDAPPGPAESIWKTPSSVAQDEVPLVATRDGVPLVAAPDDLSRSIEPEAAVEHHRLPSVLEREAMLPVVAAQDETVPARPSTPRHAPVTQGADSLLLSDVLERRTPVHWSEAVAAVEELCVAIDAGPSDRVLVPDLADVFITPDGLVGVRQGAAGEPDVAALGRALQSLVGTGDTPLPLRLFVTSAVAPDRFASVALFADALSYYALPDRAQLIQALYRRAIERRPALPVVTPRKQPTVVVPPPAPAAPNRGRTMKTWTMAAAAGIIVGTFAGVWLWSAGQSSGEAVAVTTRKVVPPPAPKRTEDWTPGPILIEGARPAVPPSRSDASRTQTASRAGNPSSVTAREESTQPRAPIPSPPLVPLNARPAPATVLLPPQPLTGAVATPAAASTAPSNTTAGVVFSETPVAPPVAKPPVVVDSRIYSAADLDVDEPVLLSTKPILPSPASRRDAQVSRTFELTVDHEGKVQSSKLVDGTQVLSDVSLPQQLKLLKFRPAVKDGRPVNYRYRLRLTSNPE